jgi:hypothetical protein
MGHYYWCCKIGGLLVFLTFLLALLVCFFGFGGVVAPSGDAAL